MPDSNELENILRSEGVDLTPEPETTPNNQGECLYCNTLTAVKECKGCHALYCKTDTSYLDPDYCSHCLNNADITKEPLKDADGQVHEGALLHPVGPAFGTTLKNISQMTGHELENHIAYYKSLVQQAERSLDFRRVILGASQVELAERKDAERRKLRAIKTPNISVKAASTDGKPKQRVSSVEAMAAQLGLSKEKLAQLLIAVSTKPAEKKS